MDFIFNRKAMIVFAVFFLLIFPGYAQFSQRGGVEGFIFDSTGAAIPGAKVTLTNLAQSDTVNVQSEANGHFQFTQLLAGQYRLRAERSGFDTSNSEAIQVNIGEVVRYNLNLKTGSASEQITVSSSAPLLDTDRSSIGEAITAKQVEELPLNGRNFTSLAALLPGVSTIPEANLNPGGTFQVGANFSSGGVAYTAGGLIQGSRDNGFYLNGVNINENYVSGISYQPSQEALAEANIHVADFSAASGHDFTTLSIQTKGGSSSFHGHIYDYIENDAFNAVNSADKGYFGTGAVKPTLRRNQYGGGLGGPVYIPKLLPRRDLAFFFANYERFKESDGSANGLTSVPSDAERTGDFSELLGGDSPYQLYNPFLTVYDENSNYSRPAIANNRLDQAARPDGTPLVDPTSAKVLSLYPAANIQGVPSYLPNYRYTTSNGNSNYHFDSRFDVHVGNKNSLFVAWSRANGSQNVSGGIFPDLITSNSDKAWLVTANDAHAFSSHLTNEFIFGVGRGIFVGITSSQLSKQNSSTGPFNSRFANVGTGFSSGLAGIFLASPNYASPYAEPFLASNRTLQFSDNLDWIKARHHLTFGFDFFRKGEYDWNIQRYVTYSEFGAFTACGNNGCGDPVDGDPTIRSGDALADVVLGIPSRIHQRDNIQGGDSTAPELDISYPSYGLYANDRFQLNPKLSLSYGIRYDLVIPFYANNNYCCGLYQPDANGGTIAIPGRAPGLSQHYLSPQKTDFAPRLSIAYQPDSKTVVRAGYGIFFDSGATQLSTSLNIVQNAIPGNTIGVDLSNATLGVAGGTPALTTSQIFPAAPSVPLGEFPVSTGTGQGYFGDGAEQQIYYLDQKSTKLSYYQRMLVDFQESLSPTSSLTLSYIGALGRHGSNFVNINLPAYQTGWPDQDTFNNARPNNAGRFSDIYVLRPTLNSSYSAGIVRYERRLNHGVQFLSSYTFGKTISDYPTLNPLAFSGAVGGGAAGYQYPNLPNRAESSLSHRHRFTYSGIWEPGYGKLWPAYLKVPLAGWRLSGIGTIESGDAYTLVNGQTSAQDYAGTDSLNVTGNPNLGHGDKSFTRQFKTEAFSVPDENTRGNAGFGVVRGPGQLNVDLSLAKTITLYEGLHLDLRSDFFNAMNHSQWTGVATQYPFTYTGYGAVPFGQVTGSREARIIQLGAKLAF